MITAWLLYIATGAFAGVLAGLLGVGGGLVIVPMLNFVFHIIELPGDYIQHLALGTSLASIMFTSVSSLRAHHQRGAVVWAIVKAITPGILIGTFLGSKVAAHLSSQFLSAFFVVFLYYVAAQMLLNIKPKATRQVPGTAGMFAAGSVIGGVSSLVGIGGGTLSVPFMTWCNVALHTCIGTSAAIGFPIAVAGTAGYIVNGLSAPLPGLDAGYLGFIYLPALVGVAAASILTAPLGAKLAHSLPVGKLKKIFACLLVIMGTKMLWPLIAPYFG
ncbi:MAG TPA: sulfite exporter TauE/SafE family protein [Humidesulfovibrio sp.]|uniref:sulfite exporter TauE/SafE family protein n=1 Tax=Humidesulfovibrio sp. TaxID=2910988 RepID=UPI002C408174|nr:sulfite exporter TauE/SafE family protein [Humidesulfovibrio sp.]HWR05023.1 sulfite exporter TauE/SafE family protein [Humidesulfovibrio sp.]